MRRVLFTRRWLGLTALMLLFIAVFLGLGWWQWHRATVGDNARSFGYALEWPFFAAMVLVMWVKTLRDDLRGSVDTRTSDPRHFTEDGQSISSGESRSARRRRALAAYQPTGGTGGGVSLAAKPAPVPAESRGETGAERDDTADAEVAAYNRYLARRAAGETRTTGAPRSFG